MVHESIYDEYVERAVERAKKKVVGNPFQDDVDQGNNKEKSFQIILPSDVNICFCFHAKKRGNTAK